MDTTKLLKVALSAKESVAAAAAMTRSKPYNAVKSAMIAALESGDESVSASYVLDAGNRNLSWSKDKGVAETFSALTEFGYLKGADKRYFVELAGVVSAGKVLALVDTANGLNAKKAKFNETVLDWIVKKVNSESLTTTGIVNDRAKPSLVFDADRIISSQSIPIKNVTKVS